MAPSGTSAGKDDAVVTGTVRWFSPKKGFGFIGREDGDDVFVHHSVIEMDGYRTLEEGQLVEYEVESSDKGDKATVVRPV